MHKGLVNRWLCVLLSFVLSASLFPADALAEIMGETRNQEPEVVQEEPTDELEEESDEDESDPEAEDDSPNEEPPIVDDASPDEYGEDGEDDVTPDDPASPEEDDPEDDEAPEDEGPAPEEDIVTPDDPASPEGDDPEDDEEVADDEAPEDEEPTPEEEEVVTPDDPATPEEDDEETTDEEAAPDESDEEEAEETDPEEDPEATDDDEEVEPKDDSEDKPETEDESEEDELSAQNVDPLLDASSGFEYLVNSSGTTISLYRYVGSAKQVCIPLKIGGRYTSCICDDCFTDNETITMVYFDVNYASQYQLTSIGSRAFQNCTNLVRVELPDSVMFLGESCFEGTRKLQGLNILGIKWSGNASGVAYSFDYHDSSRLEEIGDYCFFGSGIEIAYFGSCMKTIGKRAFDDCSRLRRVAMFQFGITSVGNAAFANCTKLTEVMIPRQVTSIGENMYYGCSNLQRVHVYEDLVSVGNKAFYGCKKLEEFGMPGNRIYYFGTGRKLTTGTFEFDNNNYWDTTPGTIHLQTIGNYAFVDCQALSRCCFPSGLTSIGQYAFLRCYDLQSASLPDTVTRIGRTAFADCESLTTFTFPSNSAFKTVEMEMLSGCTSLKTISIPVNVTKVCVDAFDSMAGLEKAYFFNKSTTLEISGSNSPFTRCKGKPVVYGPTGGNLQTTAATCKSLGHIKSFNSLPSKAKVTYCKYDDNGEKVDKEYSLGSDVALGPMSTFGSWTYEEGGETYGLYGWSKRAGIVIKDGNVPSDVYAAGQSVRIDGDATYYAVYSKDVAMVDVTFHNPDAATDDFTKRVAAGSRLTLPSCKTISGKSVDGKTGWRFTGWYFGGSVYQPGDAITVPDTDTTISAKNSTTYLVKFKAQEDKGAFFLLPNGDTTTEVEVFTEPSGFIAEESFPMALRNGNHLTGWQTYVGGGTTISVLSSTDLRPYIVRSGVVYTLEIYPTWDPSSNPEITFDASPGKIGSSSTKVVTTNSLFMINQSDIPTPTRADHKFNGWAIVNPSGSQQVIGDLVSRRWSENTTLYADWSKLVAKITLDKTSATVVSGKTLQLKATVTPSDAENTAVTWKSSDTSVATVTSGGKVTAKAVGTATITVTAKDGSGKKATCKVTVTKPVSSLSITAPTAQTYTGKALKPKPAVKDGTTKLTEGTHYTLSYKNNVNAGTATVTVTGKGNYTGSKAVTFKINQATISKATFAAVANKTYTGSPIKPEPKVTFGGKTLVKGTDYTLSYKNNVNVGKATITATGRGNFKGTKSLTFTIVQADISKATVAAIADCPYAGSPIKPSPKVTYSGKTLAKVSDYEVSYKDNVKVSGKAQVVLTGKGNFKGTKVVKFRIAFNDVPKAHKFYDKIHRANDLHIINGYGGSEYGKFGPSNNITRGQIAVILWNAAGKPKPGSGAKSFPDVPADAYYTEAIAWASSKGVVNGYLNGNYGPNDYITRQQLAVMVANYAKNVSGKKVVGSAADLAGIPDAAEVADYAVTSVAWCYKNNILILQGDKLNAKLTADRATAAQMAVDLYDLVH